MDPISVYFTPLLGVNAASPLAYLLQLGACRILLDAGWDETFDEGSLESLKEVSPDVDAVLLSHPDLEHLGALPLLVSSFGLTAPIYSTMPTCRLGRLALHDARSIRAADGDFDAFSDKDIDAAFDRVQQLRWRQTQVLPGKGAGITVTSYAAGRLLGGSVWQVSLNGEDYVYAVDMNHRKERLLNGAILEQLFNRPALLITDAFSVEPPPPPQAAGNRPALSLPAGRGRGRGRSRHSSRDSMPPPMVPAWEAELMKVVMSSLRANGRVLIATDASGRVLELVLALEAAWGAEGLPYPVVVVGASSAAALEAVSSQVEWMADGVQRSFETHHTNPFDLRHVRAVASMEEVDRLPKGPAVIVASAASLSSGPSRRLLAKWGGFRCNAIVIPGRPAEATLAAQIVAAAARRSEGDAVEIAFPLSHREPLRGVELAAYEAAATADAQQGSALPSLTAGSSQPDSSSTAATDSKGVSEAVLHSATSMAERRCSGGSTAPAAGRRKWDVVIEGFTVPEGAVAPMFADIDELAALDIGDYGASIDSLDFRPEDADAVGANLMVDSRTVEEVQLPSAIPTKVVVEEVRMSLQAKVVALPAAEGRSDQRSHRTIVEHLAPRHLVIVRGSLEAREALSAHCREELSSLHTAVYTPSQGQRLQLSGAQEAFRVAIAPSLARDLQLQAVGRYEVSWVSTAVAANGEDVELFPLDPVVAGGSCHQGGVFIGDVKLSDLKAALATAGVPSEWEGPGALVAARGRVRVRLAGGARAAGTGTEMIPVTNLAGVEKDNAALLVEGSLCSEYFIVRDLLYGQYHVC